jgi:hypothetical protein
VEVQVAEVCWEVVEEGWWRQAGAGGLGGKGRGGDRDGRGRTYATCVWFYFREGIRLPWHKPCSQLQPQKRQRWC